MNLRQNINLGEIGDGWRRAISAARLKPLELISLVSALIFVAIVVFFYFSRVQPLGGELQALNERQTEIQTKINKLKTDEKKRTDQATNAEKILQSLGRFEERLKPDERGRTQIIDEIDALGKTHKVIIGDASYRVAESDIQEAEEGGPQSPAVSGEKKPKIYPAMGIDTTVIGDYPNLRKFLFDLERSKQFLIINSVQFQGEADNLRRALSKAGNANAQVQLSGPDAIPVSLKIELDTYFQKPALAKQ